MFKLLRYFSLTSSIAFIIVAVLLGAFYRNTAIRNLIELEESKNVALTQSFANSLWPEFGPFVESVAGLTGDELRTHPTTATLHQAVLDQMLGLSVVKVKVYNLDGLTVFSSDESQMGEDKSKSPGFNSARSGVPISHLTHRDTFNTFEEVVEDRDIIESYVPILPDGPSSPVAGVIELYSDVTPLMRHIDVAQTNIVIGVLLSLGFLYAILFLIVRHGQNIMHQEHEERLRIEEQLRHDALHDALTGLPNRALFMDRLGRAVERGKRRKDYFYAVLYLDLDRFKVVNDSLGHARGDQLLVMLARRLERCLRAVDTVARLGGDEFVILLEDLKDVRDANLIASRVQEEVRMPFDMGGNLFHTSASIGIILNTLDYHRAEEVLRDADIAMYRAKINGKDRAEVFNDVMRTGAIARLEMEAELRKALDSREFHVDYQPIVTLDSGKLIGFEALLRWQHPDHGFVSPVEFMSVAEESGLIIPLGWQVLREAVFQIGAWQKEFPMDPPLIMSVNISSRQFMQSNLVEQLENLLQEAEMDANNLQLEIVESVIMGDPEKASATLLKLRDLGIQVQIDDFGMGYSTLNYLNQFPIDTIKIDSSFIGGMDGDGKQKEIVETIFSLAHSLNMSVIAEGVETTEQLNWLNQMNCEFGQGFLFANPMDKTAAEAILMAELPMRDGGFR